MSSHTLYGNLFLSIGAMKAGTTWLYSLLSRHPELHFSLEKEVHYLYDAYVWPSITSRLKRQPRNLRNDMRLMRARDTYLNRIRPGQDTPAMIGAKIAAIRQYLSEPIDDHWYQKLFQDRPDGAYACDFSNLSALLSARHWARVEAKCTKLRVLYTMRDPVERLWSHAKFFLEHSGQPEAVDTWGAEQYIKLLSKPHISVHSEYGKVVRTLRKALPETSHCFLFYEDIHADRRGALRQIEEFLEIAPFDYPENLFDRRQAASMKREMPAFFPEIAADISDRVKGELLQLGLTPPDSWR